MTFVPTPGSDEAREQGCTCPVIDNGRGRNGPPFWIAETCPLHYRPEWIAVKSGINERITIVGPDDIRKFLPSVISWADTRSETGYMAGDVVTVAPVVVEVSNVRPAIPLGGIGSLDPNRRRDG